MPEPGDLVGRYRIESLLGEGGMGAVYVAHDTSLHRHVALKVVRPGKGTEGTSAEAAARLVREARAAAAIQHPNAVAVYDVGEHEDTPYIAMELVDGRPLRELVGLEIPWRTRVAWLLDIARALSAAHARGIVHRDVKPENVMIRADGAVKVLDFGIARRSSGPVDPISGTEPGHAGLATITGQGVAIGTPLYMAPEQLQGKPIDGRADQFSWGIVAYELLAGTLPWTATNAVELVAQVLSAEFLPLAPRVPGLPPAVADVVARALSRRPEDRFASMDALVSAASSALGDGLGMAPTEMQRATVAPPGKPRRTAPVVVALVLAACVVTAGVVASRSRAPSSSGVAGPVSGTVASAAEGAGGERRRVKLTDLAVPASTVPDARTAFSAGLQAERDGAMVGALEAYNRAQTLDPAMAAAVFRTALRTDDTGRRAALTQRAMELRAALDPHHAALLEALAPCLQGRGGTDVWCVGRMRALVERSPDDADYAAALVAKLTDAGRFRDALVAADAAIAIDPAFGTAWTYRANLQAYLGDFDQSLRDTDRCAAVSTGESCLDIRWGVESETGRCVEAEATARAILTRSPKLANAWSRLAHAEAALGRPETAVRAALDQAARTVSSQFEPEAERAWSDVAFATWRGDFKAALVAAETRKKAMGATPNADLALDAARTLVTLATETGDLARAATVARAARDLRPTLVYPTNDDDNALAVDAIGPLLLAERHAGKLTREEARAARDRWIAEKSPRLGPDYRPYLWVHAYAEAVDDADDAREAVEALPRFGGLPKRTAFAPTDPIIGRTLLLAGRVDEAIVWLERGARTCRMIGPVWASRWLGEAREQKGERDAACAAYDTVVQRWGAAKPRSVTADDARRRMTALGCAKKLTLDGGHPGLPGVFQKLLSRAPRAEAHGSLGKPGRAGLDARGPSPLGLAPAAVGF